MKIIQKYFLENLKSYYVAMLTFIVYGSILFFFQKDIGGKTLLMISGLAASYYSYHNIKNKITEEVSKGILWGLSTILFVVLIFLTMKAAISENQWDFLCFYMQGQLGVHKLDFYDSNSFNILLQKINFQPIYNGGFKREILDVGLLSPPITMLFFAPLAYLEIHNARLVLSILGFIFIIANAILANIAFIKNNRSIYSFLFIFIIIMVLPGTFMTVNFNQTNFFLLFLLVLTIYTLDKPVSGIYLALSLIIKPITGILILFYIVNKKWTPFIYFCLTGILLVFITGFLWGFHNITGFLQSPPTQRLPNILFEQDVNQSLIAVLNRNSHILGLSQNIVNTIFYLSTIILLGITGVVSKVLYKINLHLSFFPFILFMLMIYPSSLIHYMVYLTPILIYFLFLRIDSYYLALILLLSLSFLGTETFFTYLSIWIFLLYISLFQPKELIIAINGNSFHLSNSLKYKY